MPQTRYSSDWKQLATSIKEASNWRCYKCGRDCLRPGENKTELTLSQRRAYNLQVHHWNMNPEDNRLDNLVCLCAGLCRIHVVEALM